MNNIPERIDMFKIIDINEIKRQNNIKDTTLVDFCVGYDDNIYLLFSMTPPERINGMFVDTTANAYYYAFKIIMDWRRQEQVHVSFYNFGQLKFNYHYIRPIGDYFLLLGARCRYYNENNTEQNALIIDENGNVIREMCLGDGIEDCMTTADMKIITSYFDEGVFGNLGWDRPVGTSGLIIWDCNGEIMWENTKYPIYDCYAMNIDSNGRLWFYYYNDFNLVRTDLKNDIVIEPKIETEGFDLFAISESQQSIIFGGGYEGYFFYICDLEHNSERLGAAKKIDFYCDNILVGKPHFNFCGSKLLSITNHNVLFGYYFI